jgi:alpha-beta hydrolase superfamily lysophospholipase
MYVELTSTTTSDGVKLHGIFLGPENPRTDLNIDAMLMVHGSGANFYASPSNVRAEKFNAMGIPVALFNMRGHDVIAGHSGDHKVGNAWEILDETRLDIEAVVSWLADRGYKRIATMGSSLGAVKVVYAQAKNQDPRVAAVIALAPLRFSHEYYSQCEMKDLHLKYTAEAKALVAAGNGDQIMHVEFPNPNAYFSANVYLDRHSSERYNLCTDHTDKVKVPLLIATGSEEKHPRMLNAGRDMYAFAKDKNPGLQWLHLEGGSHGLENLDDQFMETLLGFLGARQPVAS